MRKWLFLLRAFFPSWKFFDDVGPELLLEARYRILNGEFGPWVKCLPPIPRSFGNLISNPIGNYYHACHNLLNHLSADIQEVDLIQPEAVAKLTSFKLVRNLAFYQARKLEPNLSSLQFRLSAIQTEALTEEILVSPVYEAADS